MTIPEPPEAPELASLAPPPPPPPVLTVPATPDSFIFRMKNFPKYYEPN